jgi:hypothetical protein
MRAHTPMHACVLILLCMRAGCNNFGVSYFWATFLTFDWRMSVSVVMFCVFASGLVIESVADLQKWSFKQSPGIVCVCVSLSLSLERERESERAREREREREREGVHLVKRTHTHAHTRTPTHPHTVMYAYTACVRRRGMQRLQRMPATSLSELCVLCV